MAGIPFDFLAQAADVNVDRAGCHERSFFPDRVEQLIPGEDPAAMGRKIFEKTELAHCGQHIMSADLNGHAGYIDFEIAEAKHLCPGSRVTQTAQNRSNS